MLSADPAMHGVIAWCEDRAASVDCGTARTCASLSKAIESTSVGSGTHDFTVWLIERLKCTCMGEGTTGDRSCVVWHSYAGQGCVAKVGRPSAPGWHYCTQY